MTVSYSRNVATSHVGTFVKLLFRWRGSIYKLMYREVLIFLAVYASISIFYRYVLTVGQRDQFEQFALFCEKTAGMIPLTFILGFYVSLVVGRWWNIFSNITWPDRLLLQCGTFLQGSDERARMSRRTVARYINLAQLLVFRDISSAVRKRFPTMQHIIDGGFLTDEELKMYESVEMVHHKFWIPLQWTCSLLYANRKENRIENDQMLVRMVNEILTLRSSMQTLLNYDWVSIPLVYTQVVTIAVYSYFLTSIFGHQFLDPAKNYADHKVDMYFPLFTLLQFIFYMGWLKVAESIMNPLGEDDDDFEVNYLIERNLQVSYAMADDNCMRIPPLKRDIHWNEPDAPVPHTTASAGLKDNPHIPSATGVGLPQEHTEGLKTEILRGVSALSVASNVPNGALRSPSIISAYLFPPRRAHSGVIHGIRRVFSTVSHPFHRQHSHGPGEVIVEEPSTFNSPFLIGDESISRSEANHLHPPTNHVPRLGGRSISLQINQPVGPSRFLNINEFKNSDYVGFHGRSDSCSSARRKNNTGEELQPLVVTNLIQEQDENSSGTVTPHETL